MSAHEVVVLRTNPEPDEVRWSVAVCFDCMWRGRVWDRAQTAVDEANVHRHLTANAAPETPDEQLGMGGTG